jgi:hypothetical protein
LSVGLRLLTQRVRRRSDSAVLSLPCHTTRSSPSDRRHPPPHVTLRPYPVGAHNREVPLTLLLTPSSLPLCFRCHAARAHRRPSPPVQPSADKAMESSAASSSTQDTDFEPKPLTNDSGWVLFLAIVFLRGTSPSTDASGAPQASQLH